MCLAWLHCITSESQWFQYFKLIFLEIQDVPLRTVFVNPVTYVLAKRTGMDISMEDVDSMSSEQKHELLCSDLVTTARHLSQWFQKFIAFMKSSSKPIGDIKDYFWRMEFQPPCTFTVVGERCS